MRKEQQVDWRRTKVLELASEGYNQTEICQKLQLDKSTVNRDIQFLRQQAQDNLQKHIHEVVPEESQKCMVWMKQNLKHVLEIGEAATDPRFRHGSQRKAAMNITRVPLLVILVVLAQHASIIMSSGGSSDGGHHGTG